MPNPTPKADGLRRMRETTRGHLQARVVTEQSSDVMAAVKTMMKPSAAGGLAAIVAKPARKRRKLKRKIE